MELLLCREACGLHSTPGKLYIDGVYFCETLEDLDRKLEAGGEKVYGQSAIPRGSYTVVLDYSQRFKTIMPHVMDVPGFTGIRIHSGNVAADTDGCVLVGVARGGKDRILNSRAAFAKLMVLLEDAFMRGEDIVLRVE